MEAFRGMANSTYTVLANRSDLKRTKETSSSVVSRDTARVRPPAKKQLTRRHLSFEQGKLLYLPYVSVTKCQDLFVHLYDIVYQFIALPQSSPVDTSSFLPSSVMHESCLTAAEPLPSSECTSGKAQNKIITLALSDLINTLYIGQENEPPTGPSKRRCDVQVHALPYIVPVWLAKTIH